MVFDASVAVKWFLQEDRSGDALALLASDPDPMAPALILFEVMNALWTAVRARRAPAEILPAAQQRMPALFSRSESDARLFTRAASLMIDLAHPVYDRVYIPLAQREGATLVTADERQLRPPAALASRPACRSADRFA